MARQGALERSPNTVRPYAISSRLWFKFLAQVPWAETSADDGATFGLWLQASAPSVIMLTNDRLSEKRSATAGVMAASARDGTSGMGRLSVAANGSRVHRREGVGAG